MRKVYKPTAVNVDVLVRTLLNEFLTLCGYKVACVSNGGDAPTLIEAEHYDILIIDCIMPGINSIELIRKVRNMNLSLPIIGISGSDNEEDFLAAGANLFMGKPISLSMLV